MSLVDPSRETEVGSGLVTAWADTMKVSYIASFD